MAWTCDCGANVASTDATCPICGEDQLDDDELLWEEVEETNESAAMAVPTHFVFGKRGAVVRAGPSLDSAILRELSSLTEITVVEHVRGQPKMMRAPPIKSRRPLSAQCKVGNVPRCRLGPPFEGWLSQKVLREIKDQAPVPEALVDAPTRDLALRTPDSVGIRVHLGELGGDDGLRARVVARAARPTRCIVLLHDAHAPVDVLVPLAHSLLLEHGLLDDTAVVLPEGPDALALGPEKVHSWWPPEPHAVERLRQAADFAARHGDAGALGEGLWCPPPPEGALRVLRSRVHALLRGARAMLGDALERERTVVGGFGQGGALALDAIASLPPDDAPPGGVALLSAHLVLGARAAPLRRSRVARVMLAHGEDDREVPVALAKAARERLSAAGCSVEYVRHAGGHEVPFSVARRLARFAGGRPGAAESPDSADAAAIAEATHLRGEANRNSSFRQFTSARVRQRQRLERDETGASG